MSATKLLSPATSQKRREITCQQNDEDACGNDGFCKADGGSDDADGNDSDNSDDDDDSS